MIHTILQILVFQMLFLAFYELILKKETFFNGNRAYLLITSILAVVLPFVSFEFIQQQIPQLYTMELPSVMLGSVDTNPETTSISISSVLMTIWFVGMLISASILGSKLFRIYRLGTGNTSEYVGGIKLISIPNSDTAFSFLNKIYLGDQVSEESKTEIIAHETIHIQQKHSWDLLYFELMRIVFWFNPCVYLYQRKIAVLHEYIADAEVVHSVGKKEYYLGLLATVFQAQKISFINTFFNQSLIKKRIMMLRKSKSRRIKMTKYLLILPVLGLMLVYAACSNEADTLMEEQNMTMPPPPPPPPVPLAPPPPPPPVLANKEVVETEIVPFATIETVPVYPGCSGDNDALKECMSKKISEYVNSNFNHDILSGSGLEGQQRIMAQFKIDSNGDVADIQVRAPQSELEKEVIRVIEGLPKMEPGVQDGKKVGVLYSLPIIFEVK